MAAEPFVHPFLTEKNRSQPVLVAMGRVAHQKGFDVLIRSLAWLKVKYKAKLLVIGHGSAKNVDRLRALASKLHLSDSIDFLDYQANPFAIMSKADMFVSASRRSEEHTSELQSLMRISYAVFCLKKINNIYSTYTYTYCIS